MKTVLDFAMPVTASTHPAAPTKSNDHFSRILKTASSSQGGTAPNFPDTKVTNSSDSSPLKGSPKSSSDQNAADEHADEADPSSSTKAKRSQNRDPASTGIGASSGIIMPPLPQPIQNSSGASASDQADGEDRRLSTSLQIRSSGKGPSETSSLSSISSSIGNTEDPNARSLQSEQALISGSSSADAPSGPSISLITGAAEGSSPQARMSVKDGSVEGNKSRGVSEGEPASASTSGMQLASPNSSGLIPPQSNDVLGATGVTSAQPNMIVQAVSKTDLFISSMAMNSVTGIQVGAEAAQVKDIAPKGPLTAKQSENRVPAMPGYSKSASTTSVDAVGQKSSAVQELTGLSTASDKDSDDLQQSLDSKSDPTKTALQTSMTSPTDGGNQLLKLETHLAVPVDRQLAPSMGREIVSTAQSMSALERVLQAHSPESGSSTVMRVLQIQLSPPDLGNVSVKMTLQGSALDLQVSADQTRTRNLIERDRQIISDSLSGAGYSVNSMTIDQTSASSGTSLSGSDQNTPSQSFGQDNQSGAQPGQASSYSNSNGQQGRWNRGNDQDPDGTMAAVSPPVSGQGLFV